MALDTVENLEDVVIYEVFARAWGGFEEVKKDLPRISSMGINTIWFMPIHPTGVVNRKGTLGSPYAIKDYRIVDEALGGERAFKQVVKSAHENGMKVLMDVVFNHMATDSVLTKEHPEWFLHDENGPTRKVAEWTDVVDFDFSNYDLVKYLIDTLKFWVAEYDIDGFRCDVASLIPISFWNRARAELSEMKKLLWVSESKEPYMYQAFDLTYDYDTYDILRAHFDKRASLIDYANHLRYQKKAFNGNVKLRFLENHDQQRIASRVPREKLKAWTAFLFAQKGAILIYNGQEFAFNEKPDIFNEYKLDFSNGDEEFYNFFSSLLNLRKRMPVMKYGEMHILKNDSPHEVIALLRNMKNYLLFYVGNLEGEEKKVNVDFGDLLEDGHIHAFDHVRNVPYTFSLKNGKAEFEVDDFLLLSSVL